MFGTDSNKEALLDDQDFFVAAGQIERTSRISRSLDPFDYVSQQALSRRVPKPRT